MDKATKIYRFTRNGSQVFLDSVRDIFVPETPEETVRQHILLDLMYDWKIPKDYIRVEENMSHYKKGARDRADIIVLHPETEKPWLLFELKAPDVHICDDTLQQAEKYNKILRCKYICLSNSNVTSWFVADKKIKAIKSPKDAETLLNNEFSYLVKEPYIRPAFEHIDDTELIDLYTNELCIIGQDTPLGLHQFITNFDSFLVEEVKHIESPLDCGGFTIVEDGIRNTSFGNVGGGSYDGLYRYYILRFENGDHNIVSLAVFGTMKAVNDPHWGNRNSYTSLVVAIDDFDKKHNSLQLNLDSNLSYDEGHWYLHHDGKLTSGKRGACKVAEVVDFCRNHIPDLIDGKRFFLGALPKGTLFTWDNSKDVVINLIRYALARDAFRKQSG